MKKQAIVFLLGVVLPNILAGQSVKVPFDSEQWEMGNAQYSLQQYEGKDCMLLQSGFLYIKDLAFLNGTIEVDINFSAVRNFNSVSFRIHSPGNFEQFYIRPHQSGNPDANQYTPVFNGLGGWQLYHGEKYATPVNYTFNQWHHLKIVVAGNQAEVYFDDMKKPLLKINELLHETMAGTLGLGTRTNAYFANFQYTLDDRNIPDVPVEIVDIDGLIEQWQLSDLQSDDKFKDKIILSSSDTREIKWSPVPVQSSGVLNIAQYLQRSDGKNTGVVKLSIQSDRKQIRKLDLGYSDFVGVYVNGEILYSGATNFVSRDYRYLGTIGFFDSVYLPLKKGNNEILFVVRENFGGWGIQAVMNGG